MIDLNVSGGMRTIAESAWISTIDDIKAKSRSDDDAERVVRFLVENNHTSPIESVTLEFSWAARNLHAASDSIVYITSKYARYSSDGSRFYLTIDLLNFVKITNTHYDKPSDSSLWTTFLKEDEQLASIIGNLNPPRHYLRDSVSVVSIGDHGMTVELMGVHNSFLRENSRATWRVKCPLSIAVQMLRHRSGSFNMVSGRYRTIKQSMIGEVSDFESILKKLSNKSNSSEGDLEAVSNYFSSAESSILSYKEMMISAGKSKKNELITNEEYKRLREVARYILPEGRMTELYVTFYLDDFERYLVLRDSEYTQREHVWIARTMCDVLNESLDASGTELIGGGLSG